MPVKTDNTEPSIPTNGLRNPANDPPVWKLEKAIEFWGTSVEKPDFCNRWRKGEVAGITKPVILATQSGTRPHPSRAKKATLVLHRWDSKYCFWTLKKDETRLFAVYLLQSASIGDHWARWIGVAERFEDKAIAFPIEDDDSDTPNDAVTLATGRSPFNIPTQSESRQASDMDHAGPTRASPINTASVPRRSKRACPPISYTLPKASRATQATLDTPNSSDSDEEEEPPVRRSKLTRRCPTSPSTLDRPSSQTPLYFSEPEALASPPPKRAKTRRWVSPPFRNSILLSDTEDPVQKIVPTQPQSEDVTKAEVEFQKAEQDLEYKRSHHAVLEAERRRDELKAKVNAVRAAAERKKTKEEKE